MIKIFSRALSSCRIFEFQCLVICSMSSQSILWIECSVETPWYQSHINHIARVKKIQKLSGDKFTPDTFVFGESIIHFIFYFNLPMAPDTE